MEKKEKTNKNIKDLKNKDQNKKVEIDYKDKYLRSQAEMVNMQKRFNVEKMDLLSFTKAQTIVPFLNVLDNFNLLLKHTKDESFVICVKQFKQVIESVGITKLDLIDTPFNAQNAEAIEQIETEDEKQDNKIAEVLQDAYQLNDKIIRPARVKVYKFNKQ